MTTGHRPPRSAYLPSQETVGRTGVDYDIFSHSFLTEEFSAGLTSIMSPTSLIVLGATVMLEHGDQSKPYRYVPLFPQGVNPPAGATYLIDPTLRRDFQTLSFKAVSDGAGPVIWAVDGRDVGQTARDGAFSWPLAAGAHRIVARDGRGNAAEALITVR